MVRHIFSSIYQFQLFTYSNIVDETEILGKAYHYKVNDSETLTSIILSQMTTSHNMGTIIPTSFSIILIPLI